MRRNLFSCSQSNVAILSRWPFDRPKHQREYPHGTPRHDALVAKLCPMRTTLTSAEHDGLRWDNIKELCQ